MQVDISRPTFDPLNHFVSVAHLQGRVLVDADLNEQAAIMLHQIRTAMADLVGPAAMPFAAAGFQIVVVPNADGNVVDLRISPGRAYVDGILVENEIGDINKNETWVKYSTQPDGYLDVTHDDKLPDPMFAVYLRVWERAITAAQVPDIREIALGDLTPDTAARVKVIWQVAVLPFDTDPSTQLPAKLAAKLVEFDPHPGQLAARALRPLDADADPCHTPPEARYRGPENQLYRVEVHSGGPAWVDGAAGEDDLLSGATFKWSRENASVVLPIRSLKGAVVHLDTVGRDRKLGLEVGDWVEITDDAAASRVADDRPLADKAHPSPALLQITAIDYEGPSITLAEPPAGDVGAFPNLHPLVRRWDHQSPTLYAGDKRSLAGDGALPLIEGQWITLEDGVEIEFSSDVDGTTGTYRAGRHWVIPARTVTGDVEWPRLNGVPVARPADGVHYHYAPLTFVKTATSLQDRRKKFKPVVT